MTSSRPAPVRAGRFRFRNPPLLFARVRLYPDRLELTGWHLRGHYRRVLTLRQLLEADAQEDERLLLWLANGEVLRLHVAGASAWQAAITLQQYRLQQGDA